MPAQNATITANDYNTVQSLLTLLCLLTMDKHC